MNLRVGLVFGDPKSLLQITRINGINFVSRDDIIDEEVSFNVKSFEAGREIPFIIKHTKHKGTLTVEFGGDCKVLSRIKKEAIKEVYNKFCHIPNDKYKNSLSS